MKNYFKKFLEWIFLLGIGALLGRVYCFVVLVICDYIGKSGYSDEKGVSHIWRPEHDWWASAIGVFLGVLIFPIGYYLFLRKMKITIFKIFVIFFTMILAAFIGAFGFPPFAALTGTIGFLFASYWLSRDP